jgi:hypothetical protein
MKKEKVLALYKGDLFVSVGTIKEISTQTGYSLGHIYKIKNKKKSPEYSLIELDDNQEDGNYSIDY